MGSACASFAVEVYGTETYSFGVGEFNGRFRETFGKDALSAGGVS